MCAYIHVCMVYAPESVHMRIHACVCVCLCVWCMHLSYVHTQARTEVPLPSLLLSAFCLKAGHSLNQLFAVARLASQHTLRPRPSSPPCAGVAGRSSHINFYTGAVDLNSGPHACETSSYSLGSLPGPLNPVFLMQTEDWINLILKHRRVFFIDKLTLKFI